MAEADPSADDARGARAGTSAVSGKPVMRDDPPRSESIADEGRRLTASRSTATAQPADQTTGFTRSSLRGLIVGFALGLVVGTLGTILMIPLGEPDAAEIPFGIGMLINFVALGIAWAIWRQHPRFAGVCLGITGGWVLFWFVLVQLPPFNTM